jgi:hypothetical protein
VRNMLTSEGKGIHPLGNILCPSGVCVACLGPSLADASSEMLFAAESGRKRSDKQASKPGVDWKDSPVRRPMQRE